MVRCRVRLCSSASRSLRSADAQALAADLHEGVVRRAIVAHHHAEARHAFRTDDADLDLFACAGADHRGDASLDEVDVVDAFAARGQVLPHRKVDRRQMRLEQLQILARKLRQDAV